MDEDVAIKWVIDELVRQIEIRSISDHEHELMTYLEARCEELGFPAWAQPIEGAGPNVLVRWDGATSAPDLLLTSHTDTIDPVWEWNDRATVDGTVVSGLGAQDDKGCGVAIMLGALLAREAGVDLGASSVALAFVVDEEVGGKGSRALADQLRPRFVVASEGTELDVATIETGFVDGWASVFGTSMHGSIPEEADNAVEKAARLVLALLEAPFTEVQHPIAGPNTITIQRIESSAPMNAIPDRASLYITCRVFGEPSLEQTRSEVEAICRDHGATFEVSDQGGWWETPATSPLVGALHRASERATGRTPGLTRMPAWTDAHSFFDRCGSEVVVFGPGHLRAAHRPDEHIDAREIVRCARIFAELLADAASLSSAESARAKEGAS
jgi:acetylornithine deacetylase/succinyl-diaminopimelate desuccinylase-like protein